MPAAGQRAAGTTRGLTPRPSSKAATTSSASIGTQAAEAARAAQHAERVRQRRIQTAAGFCSDVLTESWAEAVAERAMEKVPDSLWRRGLGFGHGFRCRALARLAQHVLAAKKALHDAVGHTTGLVAEILGAGAFARSLARSLGRSMPLPPDAQLVAVARGLQLSGIAICVLSGDDVTRCQCFIDLAVSETKERAKAILVAGLDDWRGLARFPAPVTTQSGH